MNTKPIETHLIGPLDAHEAGSCNGCGFPPVEDLNSGRRKNGKVWQITTKTGATIRLCKGCLWDLRQQMKGVLR